MAQCDTDIKMQQGFEYTCHRRAGKNNLCVQAWSHIKIKYKMIFNVSWIFLNPVFLLENF